MHAAPPYKPTLNPTSLSLSHSQLERDLPLPYKPFPFPYLVLLSRIFLQQLRLQDEAGQLLAGLDDRLSVADDAEIVDEPRTRLGVVEVTHGGSSTVAL